MVKCELYCKGRLALQEALNQPIPSSHIRAGFMDTPEVTHTFFKEVRGSHEITLVSTQLPLLKLENFSGFLDIVACSFVGIPMRHFVVPTTIHSDLTTLALKEMFCAVADRAA
jgi:hypothetical protein